MFRYKVVVGVAEPLGDGSPSYVLRVAEKRQTLDEERPDTLEAVLNRLAAEGWEPWYLALPTSYVFFSRQTARGPRHLDFSAGGTVWSLSVVWPTMAVEQDALRAGRPSS